MHSFTLLFTLIFTVITLSVVASTEVSSPTATESREQNNRHTQVHNQRRGLGTGHPHSDDTGHNKLETARLPWARRLAVLAGQALWQPSDQLLHDALDAWAQPKEDALLARGELPQNGVVVYSEAGHGGLGNQIISLVGALYLAYGSDRLLLVKNGSFVSLRDLVY
jgi:hypothetical protein